ncbi:MAG: hypothetical protein J6T96_06925 [Bacteroidales bacterium]|nr:hypothetical protein [Bacteroidales bacterium]
MNHSATNHSAKNNKNQRFGDKEVNSIESAIRYVAYMDVMGFKDMVARNPHDVIGEKLQKLLLFISELINNKGSIFSSIFSDSIYFFTSDDKQTTLKALIEILSKVMKYALSVGLPMKGAIAKGEVSIDLVKNLTFGQPLIDAYLIEESIVLYGVVFHNSVENIVREKTFQNYVLDTKIPLKSGTASHYILRWWRNDLKESQQLVRDIRLSVSDSPRRYIDNTLDLMDKE